MDGRRKAFRISRVTRASILITPPSFLLRKTSLSALLRNSDWDLCISYYSGENPGSLLTQHLWGPWLCVLCGPLPRAWSADSGDPGVAEGLPILAKKTIPDRSGRFTSESINRFGVHSYLAPSVDATLWCRHWGRSHTGGIPDAASERQCRAFPALTVDGRHRKFSMPRWCGDCWEGGRRRRGLGRSGLPIGPQSQLLCLSVRPQFGPDGLLGAAPAPSSP